MDASCNARTLVGLTKEEARGYTGFECSRCERWYEDMLTERDIPEWWEELKVAALDGVRPPAQTKDGAGDDPCEVVARMSDAWRQTDEGHGAPDNGVEEDD
jgi:hypothetical protein